MVNLLQRLVEELVIIELLKNNKFVLELFERTIINECISNTVKFCVLLQISSLWCNA